MKKIIFFSLLLFCACTRTVIKEVPKPIYIEKPVIVEKEIKPEIDSETWKMFLSILIEQYQKYQILDKIEGGDVYVGANWDIAPQKEKILETFWHYTFEVPKGNPENRNDLLTLKYTNEVFAYYTPKRGLFYEYKGE